MRTEKGQVVIEINANSLNCPVRTKSPRPAYRLSTGNTPKTKWFGKIKN